MNQSLRTLLLLGALAGFSIAGSACSAGYGEPCDLPDAQQVALACFPLDSGGFCVYDRAHDCDSNLCAANEGSAAFCTEYCEQDSDCDSQSRCKRANPTSDTGVCVPTT